MIDRSIDAKAGRRPDEMTGTVSDKLGECCSPASAVATPMGCTIRGHRMPEVAAPMLGACLLADSLRQRREAGMPQRLMWRAFPGGLPRKPHGYWPVAWRAWKRPAHAPPGLVVCCALDDGNGEQGCSAGRWTSAFVGRQQVLRRSGGFDRRLRLCRSRGVRTARPTRTFKGPGRRGDRVPGPFERRLPHAV